MNEIQSRLSALRKEMEKHRLHAWYIPGTDPHSGEYLPARWETRAFITGFTGSFGVVVVTRDEAVLWTDSRYFIQAEEALEGSGVELMKLRVPGAVPPEQWLVEKCPHGSRVGADPQVLPVAPWRNLKNALGDSGIELVETPDLFEAIWANRPGIPADSVFELRMSCAGRSRKEKHEMVVAELKRNGTDLLIVTALDELAWIFNLRGSDIPYNPVFTGFGMIGPERSVLFADRAKFPAELMTCLEKEKIRVVDYAGFWEWLPSVEEKRVLIDPASASQAVMGALSGKNEMVEAPSVIASMKARKNLTELDGFREAMQKDGVAMVEFLAWLKNSIGREPLTEYDVGRKLSVFRSFKQDFQGDSFSPIVGYKAHGAMVHLSAGPENALPLRAEGLLLFDSGGHYLQGTTDITRTVALGKVSKKQKTDFTLVLKGMIALTNARFPEGTKGCQLDILARKALWENGLNYGHGTGHGVGHFLNVHEGPFSVRQEYNPVPIRPGMVLSNEPGIYREGEYGIRVENMMVCEEKEETPFGRFLGFDTLTMCPIDTSLLRHDLLTSEETTWINQYHRRVREELKPLLRMNLHGFLEALTDEI